MDKFLDQFSILSLFQRFFDRPDFFCKKMFGGLACYMNGLMVACLMEGDLSDRSWKGKKYPFPLWYGLLIPTEHVHQPTLMQDIPGAISHPVLGKWLYLCLENDHFEESARSYIRLLSAGDPRLGIVPKGKKRQTKKNTNKRPMKKRKK